MHVQAAQKFLTKHSNNAIQAIGDCPSQPLSMVNSVYLLFWLVFLSLNFSYLSPQHSMLRGANMALVVLVAVVFAYAIYNSRLGPNAPKV